MAGYSRKFIIKTLKMKPELSKKQYFTLGNNRRVRVIYNETVIMAWTLAVGNKRVEDLKAGKGDLSTLMALARAAINEGEVLEGRSFDLTEDKLSEVMTPENILEFTSILLHYPGKTC